MKRAAIEPISMLVLAGSLVACGNASSRRASSPRLDPAAASVASDEAPPSSPALATPSGEPPAAPSHRLRHTITLGDSYGDSSRGSSRRIGGDRTSLDGPGAPPPPPSPPVYVYPPTYGYGYGGYGYGYGSDYGYWGCCGFDPADVDRRPAKPRPSPSHPPALGEDWTPPPSYGPRFPFKTAPADPWK